MVLYKPQDADKTGKIYNSILYYDKCYDLKMKFIS